MEHPVTMADLEDLPEGGGIVLIDGGCTFCQRTRHWIERHAPEGRFVFLALQSDEGRAWSTRCGRDPDDLSTVVYVEAKGGDARCSASSTAVLRILRRMDRPYRWLYAGIVVPRPVRDWGYRVVSKNRHRLV